MYMEVTSESPNFMPQTVSVHGGPTADNAQEISNVSAPGLLVRDVCVVILPPIIAGLCDNNYISITVVHV